MAHKGAMELVVTSPRRFNRHPVCNSHFIGSHCSGTGNLVGLKQPAQYGCVWWDRFLEQGILNRGNSQGTAVCVFIVEGSKTVVNMNTRVVGSEGGWRDIGRSVWWGEVTRM